MQPLVLVGVSGFEPEASWTRTKRDTKLRHTPLPGYYNEKTTFCQPRMFLHDIHETISFFLFPIVKRAVKWYTKKKYLLIWGGFAMCTAVTYQGRHHYFGRNLDLEYSYQEKVTITPRNYPLHFRKLETIPTHYAMIGMATVSEDSPLYYEATNEKGLSMAGLNFPGLAVYFPEKKDSDNVTPFEFIPWILSQCSNIEDALVLLQRINLVDIPFSPQYPLSPLHWIIADCQRSITVESTQQGLSVMDNPVGILTNNPPFEFHLYNLRNHINVSPQPPTARFANSFEIKPFSNGMGGIGLPGDFSSASRFIKAAFVKLNSIPFHSEEECVSHFFHILNSVAMPYGSVLISPNKYEITRYSSCCNTSLGVYYYTTYANSRITAVDMHREDLDNNRLICHNLQADADFFFQN